MVNDLALKMLDRWQSNQLILLIVVALVTTQLNLFMFIYIIVYINKFPEDSGNFFIHNFCLSELIAFVFYFFCFIIISHFMTNTLIDNLILELTIYH